MDSLRRVPRSESYYTNIPPAPITSPQSVLGARTFEQYSAGQGHAIERPSSPVRLPESRIARFFSYLVAPVKRAFGAWFARPQHRTNLPAVYISTEEQTKRRRCTVPGAFPLTPARQAIVANVARRRSPTQAHPTTSLPYHSDPMLEDTEPAGHLAQPDCIMTDEQAPSLPSSSLHNRPVRRPISPLNARRTSAPVPQQVSTSRYAVPESDTDDSDSDDDDNDGPLPQQPKPLAQDYRLTSRSLPSLVQSDQPQSVASNSATSRFSLGHARPVEAAHMMARPAPKVQQPAAESTTLTSRTPAAGPRATPANRLQAAVSQPVALPSKQQTFESNYQASFVRRALGPRPSRATRRTALTSSTPSLPVPHSAEDAGASTSSAPSLPVPGSEEEAIIAHLDATVASAVVAAPADSEDLSFLDDAPPPRPQKRVSFAGHKIFPDWVYVDWHNYHTQTKQGIYPTVTRHYHTDAAIDEIVPQWHTRQDTPPATPDASLMSSQGSAVPPTPQGTPRSPAANLDDSVLRDLTNKLAGAFPLSRFRRGKRSEALSAAKRQQEELERAAAAAKQREAELAAAKAREEERRRREEMSIIKALDAQWQATLARALGTTEPTAEVAKGLLRRDLGTVTPVSSADGIGWLNDEVVNGYLSAMTAAKLGQLGFDRSNADAVPGQHSFSTHLYTTYKVKGWAGVSRWWTRARLGGQRLLRCPNVLIPVNDRSHWTLLAVNGVERTIKYYDSMDQAGKAYTKFALDMVKNNLGPAFDESEWQIVASESQQQTNALDCGVFVCMNALAITKGQAPSHSFKAAQMPDARRQVAATLLNGGFSGDFSLE